MSSVPRRSKVVFGALGVVAVLWVLDMVWSGGEPASVSASAAAQPVLAVRAPSKFDSVDFRDRLGTLAAPDAVLPDREWDRLGRDLFVPTPTMEAAFVAAAANADRDGEATDSPEAAGVAFQQHYELQGVLTGPTPFAVIDGALVPHGTEVGGYTLVEIHRDHVVLQRDAIRVILSIHDAP